jgi:hypothetical protein
MKALKIFARIFFTLFFIALIFCIVVVLTYTLGQPDRTGVSRQIITGPWHEIVSEDESGDAMTFAFGQDGEFTITKGGTSIADGYFKIDEDGKKIKLFMIPGHYTSEFAPYVKLKVFAEVSFSKLVFPEPENSSDEIDVDNPPTITFLIRKNDGTNESNTFDCKCPEATIDLYNSENDLTKNA